MDMLQSNNLKSSLASLYHYISGRLKIQTVPKLVLSNSSSNANNMFGLTGYYNPDERLIKVYCTNRHLNDILRSFSHEVIHHWQNERGDLNVASSRQYTQKDPHMRKKEMEAYVLGNILFRDWQDEKRYGTPDKAPFLVSLNENKKSSLVSESVTISIPDAQDEYPDLHNLFDISSNLQNIVWKCLKSASEEDLAYYQKNRPAEVIVPDGLSDMDNPTGILNFYISGLQSEMIFEILSNIKTYLDNNGIKIGKISEPMQSGMFKSKVIRISIIGNNMAEMDKIPEMNMSNFTFNVLFNNILGLLHSDDGGITISVEELENAIAPFINGTDADQIEKLEPHTLDAVTVKNIHSAGISIHQLFRYFVRLKELIDWAKERGYKTISGG